MQLKSKNAKTRRTAVERLSALDFAIAYDHMVGVLNDNSPDIRKAALQGLSKFSDGKITAHLRAGLRDPHETVRIAAINALAGQKNPQSINDFVPLLKDSANSVRWHAAKALDDLGWTPPNEVFKAQYRVALGEFEKAIECGAAAVDPLIAALQDGIYYQRQAVVEALSKIGDPRVVTPILGALNDEDLNVRSTAIDALARLGDTRAVEPLIKALKSTDTYLRARAAEALNKLGDRRAIEPLIRLLGDSSWEVRVAALNALGELRAVEGVEQTCKCLKDNDREVRESAVKALQKIGDLRAVEFLTSVLKDDHENVRKTARNALRRLDPQWHKSEGARRAIPELEAACKHSDFKVRQAAAEALNELGEGPPINPLLSGLAAATTTKNKKTALDIFTIMLRDLDRDMRLAAAEALSRLGDKRSAEVLVVAMLDKDLYVGRAAAQSLQALQWQPANDEQKTRLQMLLINS